MTKKEKYEMMVTQKYAKQIEDACCDVFLKAINELNAKHDHASAEYQRTGDAFFIDVMETMRLAQKNLQKWFNPKGRWK